MTASDFVGIFFAIAAISVFLSIAWLGVVASSAFKCEDRIEQRNRQIKEQLKEQLRTQQRNKHE
mgnify:CR=1 FL=1